jgi:hypothetical protein
MNWTTRVSSCLCVAFAVMALADAHGRPPRTIAEAENRRATHLAERLKLSAAQVATVLAQQRSPALFIDVFDVKDEVRPDGARHVFALFKVDTAQEECLFEERPCPGRAKWAETFLLLVQLAPDGVVRRTAVTLPFHGPLGPKVGRQWLTPMNLRLVAPRPGEPAIALVEGAKVFPPADEGGGHYSRTAWQHAAFVWDGRTGLELELGGLADGGDPSDYPESVSRLVSSAPLEVPTVTRVSCEDGCVCRLPRSIAAAAREVERVKGLRRCTATSAPLALPLGIALVADDLDLKLPTRDAATAKKALPLELAAVLGLPAEVGAAWLSQTSLVRAGWSFEGAWSAPLERGTAWAVLARDDKFLGCVYAPYLRERRPRDVVRACADEVDTTWYLLEAVIDMDHQVTATPPRLLGANRPERVLRVQPGLWWVEGPVTSRPGSRKGSLWTSQDGQALGAPPSATHHSLVRLETPCCDRGKDQQWLGWAEPAPSASGPPRLRLHRLECTRACPCAEAPKTSAEARTMVEARRDHPTPQCRPTERWLDEKPRH